MFTIFNPKKSKAAERKQSEPSAEVKIEKGEPAEKKPVKKAPAKAKTEAGDDDEIF